MGLSGIVSLISGVTSLDQTLTIAVLAMAGRFFITIAMNTGIQYTVIFLIIKNAKQLITVMEIL